MKKKVEIALLKSRIHWWKIHSMDVNDIPEAEEPGVASCALCREYNLILANKCEGCPVKAKTGLPYCQDTPFIDCSDAWKYGDEAKWKAESFKMATFLDEVYDESSTS